MTLRGGVCICRIVLLIIFLINTISLFAEYDSTYVLAVKQKYAIPENVSNGDYVDYWKKTYTWVNVGTVTYSIEQNFRNAFSLNPNTGLLTITDASQINGKIVSQDTIIHLIIRTTDTKVGFELDTAEIHIKENSFCIFIDYSYSGSETGSRSQPYNDIDDVEISPGYGYFIHRGNVFLQGSIRLIDHRATSNHPTIFGAYGSGEKPTFNGNGEYGNVYCFFLGSYEDEINERTEHVYFYSLKIRNYKYWVIKLQRISGYFGMYNCTLHNNAQGYSEAVIVNSTASYEDSTAYRPSEIINCEFDTTSWNDDNAFLKIGVGPCSVVNCSFKNSADNAIRFTTGRRQCIKHSLIDGYGGNISSGIQIRGDSATIEDVRIVDGKGWAINIITNDPPHGPDVCKVKNVYINGVTETGIRIQGSDGTYNVMHDHLIEDCLLKNGGTGIFVSNSANLIIRNNSISNFNRDGNIFISSGFENKLYNIQIYYNIIYGGLASIKIPFGNDISIFNNLVDGEIDLTGATNEVVRNNYFKSLVSAATSSNNIDIDTINTNLHFTDYANHFYKLKNTAFSAIDKGMDVSLDYDFSGTPIQGTAPDIGAYEYVDTADIRVPNDPSHLSSTDFDTDHIVLEWSDNSDNENGFQLQRAGSTLDFITIEFLDSNLTSYTDDFNLQQNNSYYYRLRAFNDFGYSDFTDTLQVYIPEIIIPELASPVLKTINTTHSTAVLGWELSETTEISYTLYRIPPDNDTVVFENILTNQYTDEGLLSNTLYKYRIKARDSYGNFINSNVCEAITLPPFTQNRVNDSLIVLFIFTQRKKDTIIDQSWYKTPANLNISDTLMLQIVNSDYFRINNDNILISNSSEKIREACQFSDEITLECWLKTSNAVSTFPATLLSLENEQTVAFSLSCAKEDLSSNRINYYINLTTNTTDQKGKPDFVIEEPVETSILQHIVFTHNKSGEESIYINNNLVASGFRPPKFETWDDQYSLVVANNLIEDSPWLGDLYLCAIYNRALEPFEIAQNYFASPFSSDSCILNSADYEIYMYPNPANDLIQISFVNPNSNTEITQTYTLSFFNQQCILLRKENVSEIMGNGTLQLNISSLGIGIYTLVLSNQGSNIDQKKLVIIR